MSYEISTADAGRQGRLDSGHVVLNSFVLRKGFELKIHGTSAISQLQHCLGEGVAAVLLALLSWRKAIL